MDRARGNTWQTLSTIPANIVCTSTLPHISMHGAKKPALETSGPVAGAIWAIPRVCHLGRWNDNTRAMTNRLLGMLNAMELPMTGPIPDDKLSSTFTNCTEMGVA